MKKTPAAKMAALTKTLQNKTASTGIKIWYNYKMLTYGPGSNIFMGQIGPFINMYSRQTVLNGSIPIKISLSRGNIFQLKI